MILMKGWIFWRLMRMGIGIFINILRICPEHWIIGDGLNSSISKTGTRCSRTVTLHLNYEFDDIERKFIGGIEDEL